MQRQQGTANAGDPHRLPRNAKRKTEMTIRIMRASKRWGLKPTSGGCSSDFHLQSLLQERIHSARGRGRTRGLQPPQAWTGSRVPESFWGQGPQHRGQLSHHRGSWNRVRGSHPTDLRTGKGNRVLHLPLPWTAFAGLEVRSPPLPVGSSENY